MFYTIFVFALGVYVGQEYTNIPSVKLCVNSAISYIQTNNNQNNQDRFREWKFEYLKEFFKKNE